MWRQKHHQFAVEKKIEQDGFGLLLKSKGKVSSVFYGNHFLVINDNVSQDSILVLRIGTPNLNSNFGMVISIKEKERIGSSDVGEELVTFFSRYGIRFNRLD